MKQRVTAVNNRFRGCVTSKYWALSWKVYLCLHKTPCYKIPYKQSFVLNGRTPSKVMEWKTTLMARQALAEGLWKETCTASTHPHKFQSPWTPITSALAPSCRISEEQKENSSLVPRGYNTESEEELHFFWFACLSESNQQHQHPHGISGSTFFEGGKLNFWGSRKSCSFAITASPVLCSLPW